MGKWTALCLCILFLAVGQVWACDPDGKTGIFEKNDLLIPAGAPVSNVTEKQYHAVLDRIEELYASIVAKAGAELVLKRPWKDGTVNAYARRKGGKWEVTMFGGLARHVEMSADGLALVACHELGHHMGGSPNYKVISWASNEGQSDYYASVKCFRRYAQKDDNVALMASVDVPPTVRTFCGFTQEGAENRAICRRTAMAGLRLASVFHHMRKLGKVGHSPLGFEFPLQSRVGTTYDRHPSPQCRLDTYFYGALCSGDAALDGEGDDPHRGFCSRNENVLAVTARPACWYRP